MKLLVSSWLCSCYNPINDTSKARKVDNKSTRNKDKKYEEWEKSAGNEKAEVLILPNARAYINVADDDGWTARSSVRETARNANIVEALVRANLNIAKANLNIKD